MTSFGSPSRLLFVGGILAISAMAAVAQQGSERAEPPVAPQSPLFGRPPGNEAAARLAPIAPPPLSAMPEQLPIRQLKVPPGFNIEVYAAGMTNARSLALGDKGTVFVGTRLIDKVYAIINRGGTRSVKVLLSGLYRPNGVAFHDGTLYIAELSKISRIDRVEDVLDNPPQPTVIYEDLPHDEAFGWKFIAVGPDNKLYIPVGQPGNNVARDAAHGQIRRINLDGSAAEVVAYGVRNSLGFDWEPRTKQLYFTDNGREWLSEDFPEDELNRISRTGEDFGAPYCYQGNIPDQMFGWGHSCSEYVPPVGLLGPHAAALGMRFYTGNMFPRSYRDTIIVARHGSWNRTQKFGGDVVVVRLEKDGRIKSIEPLVTGFLQNNNYVGRPVDVLPLKDGSVLVSDDWNGAVYRVTYGRPKR